MKKRWVMAVCGACLVALASSPARATPLTWTLQNTTFTDGGTASGSFVYDATTNAYSGINISVSAHGTYPASVFQFPDLNFSGLLMSSTALGAFDSNAADLTGADVLGLSFTNPLTGSGGTDPLVLTFGYSGESRCTNAGCSNNNNYVSLNSGNVVASTAPEPATLFSIPFGLVVLGAARQLRRRICSLT